LQQHIPGIFDGHAESVHQARVATRRIREVLPLTADATHSRIVEHLQDRFRGLGRALGRVRDADVRIVLLQYLESRIPTAAPALVLLRQQQERRRLRLVRKLIKQLETDELEDMLRAATARHRLRSWWSGSGGSRWRSQLRVVVADRAQRAAEAIRHATGVYFPNRSHAARIAIKKLRYAFEIGESTHTLRAADVIRELKKAQDILGDLHDRETLIDKLEDAEDGDGAADEEQVKLVTQVLEAEIHDLHRRFLSRRERVLSIARDGMPVHRALPAPPLLVAAGAFAVSSGALAVVSHKSSVTSRPS
jgi:CHAD domain-containing protein